MLRIFNVHVFSLGGRPLWKPKKCGISRQKLQERGHWIGGCTSLWWCNETSGKKVKSKHSYSPPTPPPTAFFKTPCLTYTTLFRSKWTKTARLLTRDLKPSAVAQQLPPALWQPSGWRGSRWVGTALAIKLKGGQWLHKTCLFIEELISLLSCCRLTRLWRSRTRTLPKNSAFLQSSYTALVSSQLHCTNIFRVILVMCRMAAYRDGNSKRIPFV